MWYIDLVKFAIDDVISHRIDIQTAMLTLGLGLYPTQAANA
jgi:hypothetical protein